MKINPVSTVCANCEYARRAENSNYVGCAAALKKLRENYSSDAIFSFYDRKEIATGWVELGARPNSSSRSGMITNGMPCFHPQDNCKHFEIRRDLNGSI